MAADQQLPRACVGCLGTEQCWICTGDGCHRCAASGRCHLCVPVPRLLQLVPAQADGERDVATAS